MKVKFLLMIIFLVPCFSLQGENLNPNAGKDLSASNETATCKDNGRCVNGETNTFLGMGISFKPVYKNQYELNLINISNSCEAESLSEKDITKLPKNSFFKKTLDNQGQNSNEMLVHVYELDKGEKEESEVVDKYFNSPFKVCLNGKHRVQQSLYKRVGGVNTGVLVVPFKLRDKKNIYSDSTIGPYISYKWAVMEILATAGISQISVSEVGTEDVNTETGLTGAIGLNFEIDTNWDVAFLIGKDYLSGEKGRNWEYQGDNWISFGIGFNFTR